MCAGKTFLPINPLMKPRRCLFNVASCLSGAASIVLAVSASAETWNVNAIGNWGTASNWSPATVPDGVGAVANLTFAIDASLPDGNTIKTVTLDGARTIGVLTIGDTNNSHAFALSGASTLTFDNGANPASITAVAGSIGQTISVPISLLSSSLNIVNSATSSTTTTRTLNITSTISAGSAGAKEIAVSGTIVSSPVTLGGIISNGGSDRTISISKTGAGTLTLSGANTFTGGVTVGAGTLNLNSAAALGTGLLTVNGGTITTTAASALTLTTNNAQSWAGNFSFGGSQGLNMGTGAVTLTGDRTITMASSGSNTVPTITVGGAIGDGGSGFSLNTAGTAANVILRLTGTNTYSGGTNVNGGLVRFINAGALPTNGALTIGENGAVSVAGIYSTLGAWLGDARLSKASTGALSLQTNNSENFDASATGFNTLSIGADSGFTVVYTGTITPGNAGYFAGGGGGTIEFSNPNAFAGDNTLKVGRGGGGKVILSSSNTYTGQTDVAAGTTLDIRNSGALGSAASGTVVAAGGGVELRGGVTISETLSITGTNSVTTAANVTSGLSSVTGINEWSGNISAATTVSDNVRLSVSSGSTFTVSGNVATTGSMALVLTGGGTGVISGNITNTSGAAGIIQNGGSTWTLSGTNSYTGGTRIDSGTISVNSIATNLGNNTTAISFGEQTGSGRLIYTGTGETTTRGILLRSDSTGNGTIEQAGTGALIISGAVTGNTANTAGSSKTLTLTGSTSGTGQLSGTIADSGGVGRTNIAKTGSGTWTISGAAKTYEGTTSVTGGILNVSSALNNTSGLSVTNGTFALGNNNILVDAATVSLGAGAVLQMGGFADTFGVLTITGAGAILNLGGGDSLLTFANSTGATWTGSLAITGWSGLALGGGTEQVNFTGGLTTPQAASVTFLNPDGFAAGTYSAKFLGTELVPDALIPEPSAFLLAMLSGAGFVLRRRR